MKIFLPTVAAALLLVSCIGTKEITITTAPEGADISVNGEYVGKSPVVTEIKQDKSIGIVARKAGYEIGTETLTPETSRFLAFVWTKNDPKAKYIKIKDDTVTIPLKEIKKPEHYTPTKLPAYTGGQGPTTPSLPQPPALRPLPDFH